MILTQTLAVASLLVVSDCTMTNIFKVGEQVIVTEINLLKLSLQILDKLTRTLWYDKLLLLIRGARTSSILQTWIIYTWGSSSS